MTTRYEYRHVNKKGRRHTRSVWLCDAHGVPDEVTHLTRITFDPYGAIQELRRTIDASEHMLCACCTAGTNMGAAERAHLDVAVYRNGALPPEHLAPVDPIPTCGTGSSARGVGATTCSPGAPS